MKKLIILSTVILLLFMLSGCGQCEHEYNSGVTTKEPTCIEEGEKTFTCSLCEKTNIESIAKKEHIYREKITKEPTYDEEGEKTFTCEYCGDFWLESIPPLDPEPFNQALYNQVISCFNKEDYLNVLKIGKSAIKSTDEFKIEIDKMIEEILSKKEYIRNQLKNSFNNKNYENIDLLYGYDVFFDEKQCLEYEFIRDLQGTYYRLNNPDSCRKVQIDGYSLQIGENNYLLEYFIDENVHFSDQRAVKYEEGTIKMFEKGVIDIIEKHAYGDITTRYYTEEGKQQHQEALKELEKKVEEKEKEKQEQLANVPRVGMTDSEVKETSWGQPIEINKTTYSWGVIEQWCYPNNKYVYLEDDIVTAIQE